MSDLAITVLVEDLEHVLALANRLGRQHGKPREREALERVEREVEAVKGLHSRRERQASPIPTREV
jgi:hypothetical protein